MASRLQLRQDNRENWEKFNPVLLSGEPGIDKTSRRLKLGDGVHSWKNLPYMKIGSQLFDFYVSSSGDDTWDGDEGAPLRTLGRAFELAWERFCYVEESPVFVEFKENYVEVEVVPGKVLVGDYFTTDSGYGSIVDISDGKALVNGTFAIGGELPTRYVVSRRCSVYCCGSVVVSSLSVSVPPFCEIVNEGFLLFSGAPLVLEPLSHFTLVNRGTLNCTGDGLLRNEVDSVVNDITLVLGISSGVSVLTNAMYVKVLDTLSPSECNICGNIGTLEMHGNFRSMLDVVVHNAMFDGNYSLSGKVEGSVSLRGYCIADGLTIGSDDRPSVILCPVEKTGEGLTTVGIVKDVLL